MRGRRWGSRNMQQAKDMTRAERIKRKNTLWLYGLLAVVAILYVVFMMRAAEF